jgi:hypothetical protein
MILRLAIVVLLAAAFARGFSELVEHSDGPSGQYRAANPCDDWSNPHCGPSRP